MQASAQVIFAWVGCVTVFRKGVLVQVHLSAALRSYNKNSIAALKAFVQQIMEAPAIQLTMFKT